MPRHYSEKFLISMYKSDPEYIGVQLALLCVKANIPAFHVARILGVSRMTIYNWFRGSAVRDKNAQRAKELILLIEEKLASGELPSPSFTHARSFTDMIIRTASEVQAA